MASTAPGASADPGLYERLRPMLPELLRFAVVGGVGSIIDLGGAAVLHDDEHMGDLTAKALAVAVASVVTYLGSKFWTFKHRESSGSSHREVALFIGLNVIGLAIAEVVIAFTTYGLGQDGKLAYNAASLLGTGLATLFRFYAYRKWVFTAADAEAPASAPLPNVPSVPDYPPWELDPAFLAVAAVANPAPAAVKETAPLRLTGPMRAVPKTAGWDDGAPTAPAPVLGPNGPVKTVNSWDTAPIGVWGSLAAAAGGSENERPSSPLIPQDSTQPQPNGAVVTAPHRHSLPAAAQEERRHTGTGPNGPLPPARPAGRHRRG